MRRIISCQFNIDTACVDVEYEDGFVLSKMCIRDSDKLETVRESDAILREEVALAGLDRDINQYFTVLTLSLIHI